MQSQLLLVLASLALPAASASKQFLLPQVGFAQESSSSVSDQSSGYKAVKLWLLSHTGTPDELAELKSVNPGAYAIVNALLTKRSLGLLDSKRPTASFANGDGSPVSRAAHPQLALAAQKLAVTYAEVQPATHQDWFNWKANAGDEDAMVENVLSEDSEQNVLGAVAELKGKKAGFGFAQESSSSVSDQSSGYKAVKLWLLSHTGSPDELAELKSENPSAYAIVKALLQKRSVKVQEANDAKTLALLASRRQLMDKKITQAQTKNPKLMEWIGGADKMPADVGQGVVARAPQAHAPANANPYLVDLKD